MVLTLDLSAKKKALKQRQAFERARRAERQYGIKLRKVARHVGNMAKFFMEHATDQREASAKLNAALRKYAKDLEPWARVTAAAMLADVSLRDEKAWVEMSELMGASLRFEIKKAPTSQMLRDMLEEEVSLITSLPLEAGERVHKLTLEGIIHSSRATEVAKEIMKTGHVTESRATLIARTETTRTATNLTAARALHIGSEGYIWRTAEDGDVRKLHKKLEGKFFRWNEPPISGENGERSLPGAIYNCRCYPEVVIPNKFT